MGSKPMPVLFGLREKTVYLVGVGVRAGIVAGVEVGVGNKFSQSHGWDEPCRGGG